MTTLIQLYRMVHRSVFQAVLLLQAVAGTAFKNTQSILYGYGKVFFHIAFLQRSRFAARTALVDDAAPEPASQAAIPGPLERRASANWAGVVAEYR